MNLEIPPWRHWSQRPALDTADILPLSTEWPSLCAQGFINAQAGLGSLSLRVGADGVGRPLNEPAIAARLQQNPNQQFPFIITGHPAHIPTHPHPEHCVRVEAWDPDGCCDLCGLALVPPELLLHVALYDLDPVLGGVVAVQNLPLWKKFHGNVPELPARALASLPLLSAGLELLLIDEGLAHIRIFTLAAQPGRVIAFDDTPRAAIRRLAD